MSDCNICAIYVFMLLFSVLHIVVQNTFYPFVFKNGLEVKVNSNIRDNRRFLEVCGLIKSQKR